jgi:hypothetical protein
MKLNIGCGNDIREGWLNVDAIAFDGAEVWNLTDRWPLDDGSVEEVRASHILEHFTAPQRCWVYNEMYRVMVPGAKATVIVPHWANSRAYGDPTHQWPPVSEMSFYYLSKTWRDSQAQHASNMLKCDFEASWGYTLDNALMARNNEYQQHAINHFTNAAMDIHATLVKK